MGGKNGGQTNDTTLAMASRTNEQGKRTAKKREESIEKTNKKEKSVEEGATGDAVRERNGLE